MNFSLFLGLICLANGLMINRGSINYQDSTQCQSIDRGFCKGMFYVDTRMPNLLGHQTQEEALVHASIFESWIQINCSKDILLLICSTYFPMCSVDHNISLPPCQSLCQRVKNDCHSSMEHLNFRWPANLNCEQFPQNGPNALCIEKNGTNSFGQQNNPPSDYKREQTLATSEEKIDKTLEVNRLAESLLLNTLLDNNKENPKELKCDCSCRTPLVNLLSDGKPYSYKDTFASINGCSQQCKSPLLTTDDEFKQVEFMQGLFGSITLACSLVNLITFLFNRKAFPYPERAITFISISFLPISMGYLIRTIFGHEKTSCEEIYGIGQGIEILLPKKSLSGKGYCASVFLLTYFFSISASLWWVTSAFTWFLSSTLRWSHECISKYSQCYHFMVWSLSGVLTALVLMTSGVEGDPISGLCGINTNPDKNFIIKFEIIPHVLFLTLGIIFCLTGFLSAFKIRKSIKFEKGTRNFEFLIMKMAIFGLLYFITKSLNISMIMSRYQQERILQYQTACDCSVINLSDSTLSKYKKDQININMIELQIISFFMIGIISSLWIVSRRGLNIWANILKCHSMQDLRQDKDIKVKGTGGNMPQLGHQNFWSKQMFDNSTASSKTAAATPLPAVPLYNQTKQLSTYANSSSPLLYHQQFQHHPANHQQDQHHLISPLTASLASSNGSQNQYYQLATTNNTLCSGTTQSISKYSKISNY